MSNQIEFYVGDQWVLNFAVAELPDDWNDLRFVADIDRMQNIGGAAELVVDLEKIDVPEGETAEGWLYGSANREDTKDLTPGRYFMQVSRWDNGEPQSERIAFTVHDSFNRTESEPA